ncbi:MAG: ImmA/IrrE family metallo-endopeptidase [Anaerolineae bacterium]
MHARRIKEMVSQLLYDAHIHAPPIDVELIAQLKRAEVRYAPFDDTVSGILYREADQIIIGVNKEHSDVRKRFTIAHEIGHLLLHPEPYYIDRQFTIRMRDGRSALAVDIHEIEANSFAAELLMPTQMLLADISGKQIDYVDDQIIKTLANLYKVSMQAMTFRLTNLGFIEPQW